MELTGVSRGTKTIFLLSLIQTSAARKTKFVEYPVAIPANVFALHGIITIESVLNEPLAKLAAILFSLVAGIVLGNGQFDIYESEALQFMFRKWEISFDTSLAILIVIGFSYSIGISFIFHAYRIASPTSIAPFEYILILYAILLGWIIWGDIIDLQSVIGLTLIVGAGLYTFAREVKHKRLVSVQKPLR